MEFYRHLRVGCEFVNPYRCRGWTIALVHRDADYHDPDKENPYDREFLLNMAANGWRRGACERYEAGQGCVRGEPGCRSHWVCPKHWGEDHGSVGRAVGARADDPAAPGP